MNIVVTEFVISLVKMSSSDAKQEEITSPSYSNVSSYARSSALIMIYFLAIGVSCSLLMRNNSFALMDAFKKILGDFNAVFSVQKEEDMGRNFRPKYAIYGKSTSESHLQHVLMILDRMGYERTSLEDDWDLLWAHDYPFRTLYKRMESLKSHQIVNHFPGCGYITNKVDLVTSNLPNIPKAFRLPTDKNTFLKYAQENPQRLFVEKHNQHRHIFIKSAKEIDLNSNSTFVQEFVENPYLVDGYKFDIGVYVIITSIDPLRVYIYKADVLFRFCPVKYYPFDKQNIDKYVVGDDYLPIWQVPSLAHFYTDLKYSMKHSFDAHLRKRNETPEVIWEQVDDIIRSVVISKEPKIRHVLKRYKYKHNFFELMRFDFIIDDKLRVFLIEANMSPNLSSAHFKQNSLLYEQVLYSLVNLVGIGSPIKQNCHNDRLSSNEAMISADKNIVVDAEICASNVCNESCFDNQCKLCNHCLTDDSRIVLYATYKEHLHRSETRRIFPKPINNIADYNLEKELTGLSPSNQFLTKWFYGKCKIDITFCF